MKPMTRLLGTLIATSLLLSGCAMFGGDIDYQTHPASKLLSLTQSVETTPGPKLEKQAEHGLDAILAALPIPEDKKALYRASDKPTQLFLEAGDLDIAHLRPSQDQGNSMGASPYVPGAVRAVVMVDGNFETAGATHALIIASGNVSIAHGAANVVIAGGDVDIAHDGSRNPGSLVVTQGHAEISHANQTVVYAEGGATVSFARGVRSFNTPEREVSHGHVNNIRIDPLFKPTKP